MEYRHFKKLVMTTFLALVLISAITSKYSPVPPQAEAVTIPTMYVDPPNIGSGLSVGETFTVDMMISDVDHNVGTEVYSWQVMMTWETAILSVDSTVIWGDFMDVPRIGPWGTLTADAAAGETILNVVEGAKFGEPGVWGGRVLIQDASNSEENEVINQLGNQLTLRNPLVNSYSVAAEAGAYPWPETFKSVDAPGTRILASVVTLGPTPGVSGSGWLCTFTFTVVADGVSALDIDHSVLGRFTYITNSIGETLGDDPSEAGDPGNYQSELLKGSGHFDNTGPAPVYWTLAVDSVPAGVEFTLDGAPQTTPYSDSLLEGSYTVVMPDPWVVGADTYNFVEWEDASTNPSRVIALTADVTVTAFYEIAPVSVPLIYVDPAVNSAGPGGSFTINISIQDAVDLFSYEAKLGYDPSILEIASVNEGPFIKDQTTSPLGTLWSTIFESDYVYAVCVTMGSYPGVSGSGVLFTVIFDVIGAGTTDLDLYDSILLDSTGALISHNEADGTFSTPADVDPPIITINEPTARDYLHSETITLDFSAEDVESGVASISATLDGMTVESGDSFDLFNFALGIHTLTVNAVDNAGNPATETVEFNIVATINSLQDLVTIFWESGYFYSPKGMYTSLIKKLYAAEAYIDAGEIEDAMGVLGAFINHLEAQSGKHVSEFAATILIADAEYIKSNL